MDEADELLQLHDEDPLPKSVITQLKRFRKPVTEMPINPGYDKQEDKDTENSAFYIPIRKSRNIYGVADISRKLKCRECFIQVTEHADDHDFAGSSYRRARPRMKVTPIPDGTRIVVVKELMVLLPFWSFLNFTINSERLKFPECIKHFKMSLLGNLF